METRANFLLIGAFTIAGILGILGFFVWLAKYQVDQQYDYYDILFSDVSGLSQAADVRFNGLPVGRVVSLQLAEHDPSLVRVRIEVRDGLPVKADTEAQLQVQGVTGLSYVSLSGGSTDAPLPPEDSEGLPTLRAERSIVEQLTEDAPDLLAEGIRLLRDLRRFASPENQSTVSSILRNVDNASGRLETALRDFSEISTTVSRATDQVADFTGELAPVAASLQRALDRSDALVQSATAAFDQAQITLRTADRALLAADALVREDAAALLAELSATAVALRSDLARLSDASEGVLGDFGATARIATARLGELQATLQAIDAVMAEADITLKDVDTAAIAFEELVEGEGTILVQESRATLARVNRALDTVVRVLDQDIPAIVADVRSAVATANRVVEEAGSDVTSFTDRFVPLSEDAGEALRTATETLRTANAALGGLDVLLGGADQTLTSARATFESLNGILEAEARPTAVEIRQSAERVGDAIEQISNDLPAVVADLRRVSADASAAMARINGVVDAAAGPVTNFAQSGLPEFTYSARELRELIERLDRIAGRLERDPARFILGGQAPDYRR
jgi:phospholipid/cholesterol/gamma-HCH transport system substrate-binding protein